MRDDRAAAGRLHAPRPSELTLAGLLTVLRDPACRARLARHLTPIPASWRRIGPALRALGVPNAPRRDNRALAELRYAGWLHQRPTQRGLVTWLRRDDLELRFPDTMRYLTRWVGPLGSCPPGTRRIEDRLRRLSSHRNRCTEE